MSNTTAKIEKKLSIEPPQHILTWDGNESSDLLADGLTELPFKNEDGSTAYRIGKLVGPPDLVRSFVRTFSDSRNRVRLTATGMGKDDFNLNGVYVSLDGLIEADIPIPAGVTTSALGNIKFRVHV